MKRSTKSILGIAAALAAGVAATVYAQGQYQGLVSTANFGAVALAPFLLVGVVMAGGRFGFVILGVWFALPGLAGPAVARWGERTRPAASPRWPSPASGCSRSTSPCSPARCCSPATCRREKPPASIRWRRCGPNES